MNLGEQPDHIRKRHAVEVPSLGALDGIVLPPIARVEVEESEQVAGKQAVLDNSAKLEDLTEKAMDFYEEVLSEPMDIDNKALLGAQQDAARTILTTQLRVDDSRLKKRSVDTLAKLLERMDAEDARLKLVRV